ncbi:MAG: hypothetical protein NVS3B16_05220 [Vulcanimicrobiaceae bacterium]
MRATVAAPAVVLALVLATLGAGCTRQQIDSAGSSLASAAPALASDGLIVAQIESKLVAIDGDSALHVAVASHGGSVRLSGRTKSAAIAQRYAAAAREVPGVKTVAAALTADASLPSTSKQVADFALATAVRANLVAQSGLNGVGVHVDVTGAAVTLRGHVKSAAVRVTLVDAAKATKGVASVTDQLQADS